MTRLVAATPIRSAIQSTSQTLPACSLAFPEIPAYYSAVPAVSVTRRSRRACHVPPDKDGEARGNTDEYTCYKHGSCGRWGQKVRTGGRGTIQAGAKRAQVGAN